MVEDHTRFPRACLERLEAVTDVARWRQIAELLLLLLQIVIIIGRLAPGRRAGPGCATDSPRNLCGAICWSEMPPPRRNLISVAPGTRRQSVPLRRSVLLRARCPFVAVCGPESWSTAAADRLWGIGFGRRVGAFSDKEGNRSPIGGLGRTKHPTGRGDRDQLASPPFGTEINRESPLTEKAELLSIATTFTLSCRLARNSFSGKLPPWSHVIH